MPDTVRRSAVISPCGKFRYMLQRAWAPTDSLTFVMLNPSTADAETDDPTIRKCMGFAKRFGYGGIVVVNLYAFRATDPRALWAAGAPEGPGNAWHIRCAVTESDGVVVCAWGAQARRNRAHAEAMFRWIARCGGTPMALAKLADGVPAHPLMLSYQCTLQPLESPCTN